MVLSLVLVFISCLVLSFFEDSLRQRDKNIFSVLLCICMILVAGLRGVGSTPDTDSYDLMYHEQTTMVKLVEPSFTLICSVLHYFSFDTPALFLTYACISVPIHLSGLQRISKEFPFTISSIYISYYYMLHDMMQIRVGVASGLFIWAIYFFVEKRKIISLLFILLGTFFHFSAIAGLVMFLLTDKMTKWHKIILYAIIPIGVVVYFKELDILLLVPDSILGTKVQIYRNMKDSGIEDQQSGWPWEMNVLIWMNIVLYYASIYYHEYLSKCSKYVTIAIKVQAIGFFCMLYLAGFSKVLASRMEGYFSIASIILWVTSIYAFYPRIYGKILNNCLSFFRFFASMLAYALALLWM